MNPWQKLAAFALCTFIVATFTLFGPNQLRAVGLVLLLCFVPLLLGGKARLVPEGFIYVAWALWAASGVLTAGDSGAFGELYLVVIEVSVVIFAVAGVCFFLGRLEVPMLALVAGGLISAVFSIIRPPEPDDLEVAGDVVQRAVGATYNPNGFAYQMLLSFMALLYLWPKADRTSKKLLVFALGGVFTFGIVTSGSRKIFLALILLVALWALLALRRFSRTAPRYVFAVCAIGLAAYWFVGFSMRDTIIGVRFQQDFRGGVTREEVEDYDRTLLYMDAFRVFSEHPIVGVGLGNFKFRSYSGQESHSDYMEVLSCTGLIGLLIYLGIYLVLWRRLKALPRWFPGETYNAQTLKAMLLTILFTALGMPHYLVPMTWAFLASIIGYTFRLEWSRSRVPRCATQSPVQPL